MDETSQLLYSYFETALGPTLRNKIAVDGRSEVGALVQGLEKSYVVVCFRHEETWGAVGHIFRTSFDVNNLDWNDHDANNQSIDVVNE